MVLCQKPMQYTLPALRACYSRMATVAAHTASRTVPHVVVVGAGVAGLTTALRILRELGTAGTPTGGQAVGTRVRVTVVAERFGWPDTTTSGAAGLWGPYKLSSTPESSISRWGAATHGHLMDLMHGPHAQRAGVSVVGVYWLHVLPQPLPFWLPILECWSELTQHQLMRFGPPPPAALAAAAAAAEAAAAASAQPSPQATAGAPATSTVLPQMAADSAARPTARALGEADVGSSSSSSSSSSRGGVSGSLPSGYTQGWFHLAPMCEGRLYLRYLEEQVRALGGTLHQASLESLQQLPRTLQALGGHRGTAATVDGTLEEGREHEVPSPVPLPRVDAVVNCTGLGARRLLGDAEVYPVRGQILRVRAPWVRHAVMSGPYYIIPNREWVVLGGTGQVGDWNTSTSLTDREDILKGCTALMPSLADAEVLDDWVGLRPGRTQVRLEVEEVQLEGTHRKMPVVHNYGHGGAGLTLAWGCAGDVVELLRNAL